MTSGVRFPVFPWHAHALQTLVAAAREGRLGHAWLVHGPAGLGQLRLAEAIACVLVQGLAPEQWSQAIPSDAGPEVLEAGLPPSPDVHRLSPEGDRKSIGVDQVRAIIDELVLTSHGGGARVVIVAPAERMTVNAANSLLKTLEEPPPGAYLLLVSHQPGRLPATIRSRCLRLGVGHPPSEQAMAWLARGNPNETSWALHLSLHSGNPVAAWHGARAGVGELDRERCAVLAALLLGDGDPGAAAQDWLASDPGRSLEWLQARLESVLRDLLAGGARAPHAEYDRLLAAARARGASGVLALRDGVLRLQRHVDGGVNLELALESLLAICPAAHPG